MCKAGFAGDDAPRAVFPCVIISLASFALASLGPFLAPHLAPRPVRWPASARPLQLPAAPRASLAAVALGVDGLGVAG